MCFYPLLAKPLLLLTSLNVFFLSNEKQSLSFYLCGVLTWLCAGRPSIFCFIIHVIVIFFSIDLVFFSVIWTLQVWNLLPVWFIPVFQNEYIVWRHSPTVNLADKLTTLYLITTHCDSRLNLWHSELNIPCMGP